MPVPPGPSGAWTSIGGLSGPGYLGQDEVPGPRRGVAQLRDHVPTRPDADVPAAADPADRRAKAPTGDPYLAQVSKAFQLVADDDGLLLYTDWASPSMYTTLQNQFQLLLAGRQTPAWRRPSRTTGRSSTRRFADPPRVAGAEPAHAERPDPAGPGARGGVAGGAGSRAGRPAQHRLALRPSGLAFYVLFTLAPLLHTVYYSLFDWDGLTGKTWVGLSNYSEALRDECSGTPSSTRRS